MAKDHLKSLGTDVLGGIISPVNDAYQKKGLMPAQHRTKMVELAVQNYEFVRCSKWETEQCQWIRTRNVLDEYSKHVSCKESALLICNTAILIRLLNQSAPDLDRHGYHQSKLKKTKLPQEYC